MTETGVIVTSVILAVAAVFWGLAFRELFRFERAIRRGRR